MYLLCIINSTEHLTHTEMKTIAYSLSPKETILTDDELVTYWIPSNLCDSDDVNLALSEWRNRLFNNSNFGWKLPKNFGRIRIAGRISELEVLLQHYQYRQNNE